jgi:hypothetical protein
MTVHWHKSARLPPSLICLAVCPASWGLWGGGALNLSLMPQGVEHQSHINYRKEHIGNGIA